MTEALVEMKNISHSFGRVSVLNDVSLTIKPGSYTLTARATPRAPYPGARP